MLFEGGRIQFHQILDEIQRTEEECVYVVERIEVIVVRLVRLFSKKVNTISSSNSIQRISYLSCPYDICAAIPTVPGAPLCTIHLMFHIS